MSRIRNKILKLLTKNTVETKSKKNTCLNFYRN